MAAAGGVTKHQRSHRQGVQDEAARVGNTRCRPGAGDELQTPDWKDRTRKATGAHGVPGEPAPDADAMGTGPGILFSTTKALARRTPASSEASKSTMTVAARA